jgi:diguanylate cyclase (GGDEF)-like protein
MRAADDLLGAASSEDGVLRMATTLLADHLGFGSCGIALVDHAGNELRVATAVGPVADRPGVRDARIPLGKGVLGCAAAQRRTIRVDDMRAEPRSAPVLADAVSELASPMIAGDELIGVVAAVAPTAHAFTSTDERVLGSFAQLVALGIVQARANEKRAADLETMRLQLRELEAVHEVAERATTLDVEATLRTVVDVLRSLTGADTAGVWIWDEDRRILEPRVISFDREVYPPDHPTVFQRPSRLGEGLIGLAAQSREALLVEDITTDPRARLRQLGDKRAGVFVPLVAEDRLLGVLRAVKLGAGSLGDQDLRLATTLGNSAALAIALVSAHEQQRARVHELTVLHEVSQHAARLDLDETVRSAVAAFRELTTSDSAGVWLWREDAQALELGALSYDEQRYPAGYGETVKATSLPVGHSLIGWAAQHREPLLVADVAGDPRSFALGGDIGPRAGIFIPLLVEQELIGVLRGIRLGVASLTEEHLRLGRTLGSSVALAVSAARAQRERALQIEELASLQRTSLHLAEATSLGEALDGVLAGAIELTAAEAGLVWRRDPAGVFTLAASHNADIDAVNAASPNYEGSLSDEMLSTGRSILFEDMQRESRPRWRGALPTMHALLGAPLRSEGVHYGALYVLRSQAGSFGANDRRHLEVLAAQAGSALARVSAFEEARRLAVTDELTGCFNARYFSIRLAEEAQRALRYARPLSLIVLDSDSLKKVNDRYGHQEGDRHIVELARTIKSHVRTTDVVARFGGDEFLVLQPETTPSAAGTTAERIRRAFRGAAASAGDHAVSVSAGVASLPESATDADMLFRQADLALYEAKKQGRDRVAFAPPTPPADGAPGGAPGT